MKYICRYSFSVANKINHIYVPFESKLVHASLRGDEVTLWAEVDAKEVRISCRSFICYGTGIFIKSGTHVFTVMSEGIGPTVWHIYEIQGEYYGKI